MQRHPPASTSVVLALTKQCGGCALHAIRIRKERLSNGVLRAVLFGGCLVLGHPVAHSAPAPEPGRLLGQQLEVALAEGAVWTRLGSLQNEDLVKPVDHFDAFLATVALQRETVAQVEPQQSQCEAERASDKRVAQAVHVLSALFVVAVIGGYYSASRSRRQGEWVVIEGAERVAAQAEAAFDHALAGYRDALATKDDRLVRAAMAKLQTSRWKANQAARHAQLVFRVIKGVAV